MNAENKKTINDTHAVDVMKDLDTFRQTDHGQKIMKGLKGQVKESLFTPEEKAFIESLDTLRKFIKIC